MAFGWDDAIAIAAMAAQTGSSIFGAQTAASGAAAANETNIRLAREQMAFQERMYKNRHQYEVEDLTSAGLNPILSAGAGGAAPGGASATVSNIAEQLPGILGSSAMSLSEKLLTKSQLKTEKSRRDVNEAQIDVLKKEAVKVGEQAKIAKEEADKRQIQGQYEKSWTGKYVTGAIEHVLSAIGRLFSGFSGK